MTTYQTETLDQFLPDFKQSLIDIHYEDLAGDKSAIPLDPDYDGYYNLEGRNALSIITVRKDGVLIGYHLGFVLPHMHYKSSIHGTTDIYYLAKEHRVGRTGLRLLQAVVAEYKKRGVIKAFIGCKVYQDHTRLLEYLGFAFREKWFTKII